MLQVREANGRGQTKIDWLNSRHTLSFGDYYDLKYMAFRNLRIINEDRLIPGGGFETQSHRDMEIVSYILSGALEHKDSLGTGLVIRPGEVQRTSAGTGITHSEFNPSDSEDLHVLQISIDPESIGLSRHTWLQVICGDVTLCDHRLQMGDGVAVSGEHKLEFPSDRDADLLLFDLA